MEMYSIATTYLELSEYNSNSVMRVLRECCFLEAGLTLENLTFRFYMERTGRMNAACSCN